MMQPSKFELAPGANPADLERIDVWAVFGLGADYSPLGGIPAPDAQGDTPFEKAVKPEFRAKAKRHLYDPAPDGLAFGKEAKVDRLLLIEYPVEPGEEAQKPLLFGNAIIRGGWAAMWHDSTTGEDRLIHCSNCVINTADFIMGMQGEWARAQAYRKSLH